MRVATWNVNSIRTRIDRVIEALQRHEIDVLAMQEIKCRPDQFPTDRFSAAGYEVAVHGLDQWNGVAVASRLPITQVKTEFPEQPTWGDPAVVEARALGVTVAVPGGESLTVWSLYVPNGRELDHPHYQYKLDWLAALQRQSAAWVAAAPESLIALVGDWNVAPVDQDVWDIEYFADKTHITSAERQAFAAISEGGFEEVTRDRVTNYTYWDYQQLRFPRNQGMRIDFVYASAALARRVTAAQIDRDERKGKGASDHVPVIIDWE